MPHFGKGRNLAGVGTLDWAKRERGEPGMGSPLVCLGPPISPHSGRDDPCVMQFQPILRCPSGDGGDFSVHEAAKVESGVMNFNKARPVVTNVWGPSASCTISVPPV